MKTTAAFGLALAAAAIVFGLHRAFTRGPAAEDAPSSPDVRVAASDDATNARAAAARSTERQQDAAEVPASPGAPPTHSPAARARVDSAALDSASESVRNASLLIAIRDAGFVCFETVAVESRGDGADTWMVVCEAMRYFVSEDGNGGLRVDPVPAFDLPVPAVETIDPSFDPGSGRELRLIPSDEIGPLREPTE